MEIGEQALHHRKAIARLDHQIHRAGVGPQLAPVQLGHRLQAAHRSGADGDHPAAPRPAGRHRRHQLGRHLHPLAVQLQLAQVFGFHRPEGAQAHMQGGGGQLHAAPTDCREQLITQVQTRRWRRNGSRPGGIAGLVAVMVGSFVPVDVGRQRDRAVLQQQRLQRRGIATRRRELHDAATGFRIATQHRDQKRRLPWGDQLQAVAGPEPFGGFG